MRQICGGDINWYLQTASALPEAEDVSVKRITRVCVMSMGVYFLIAFTLKRSRLATDLGLARASDLVQR